MKMELPANHRIDLRPQGSFRRSGKIAFPLVACLLLWAAVPALAVPANPKGREVTQPDGKKFILHLRGDEFFSWKETSDGYAVVKDSADGFWKYAQSAADKAEFRAIEGARVGSADPARLGMKKRAMPDAAVLRKHVRENRRAVLGKSVELETAPGETAADRGWRTADGRSAASCPRAGPQVGQEHRHPRVFLESLG